MDQRTCIKFCVKNEIKCADAFRMLTLAYGEATLDRSSVYRWYKMFSEGREDVNDEERAGRPSTSTTDEKINEVEKMILANRRITVREVAEDLNISIGSCHSIFINDLGMRRVAAKFVPKLLNCDQKQHRMNIANEMLDSVRDDPNLLQRVLTGDEAWVYGYDGETKAQSSQWMLPHEPRPKKARQVRSNVKVLLTVFFDCRGVVHHEFLPQGRTVNKEYYLQVMRNLREAIRQKCPDFFLNAKNNSPVEIHRQLVEVYGEKCMDIKNVRKWCREFNEGRINVHDEHRSGRPSLPESTVARIDEMVRANRRITLEEIEDGLNEDCSHFSVHKIVSETLGYRKVSARWVDKWLKEAAGEWYNTGITKLVDRMKKVIEHQGDYVEK
ncbi:hypothetical protein LAZ67_X001176 [Cordylochernes scorpioides]|uniref:Mos1 transposase HTH domain-containing protein n=1 Tax=Cordylochernes scorpioides TaxID=51811 RepID=A0ABY6LS84_9ARAC|nr:hypothetical protein LAZ67_X001176 [Cordylochernes scorpioides]